MNDRIPLHGLRVDERLFNLVRDDIAPGTGGIRTLCGPFFLGSCRTSDLAIGSYLSNAVNCRIGLTAGTDNVPSRVLLRNRRSFYRR